jgi:hypothetical protein
MTRALSTNYDADGASHLYRRAQLTTMRKRVRVYALLVVVLCCCALAPLLIGLLRSHERAPHSPFGKRHVVVFAPLGCDGCAYEFALHAGNVVPPPWVKVMVDDASRVHTPGCARTLRAMASANVNKQWGPLAHSGMRACVTPMPGQNRTVYDYAHWVEKVFGSLVNNVFVLAPRDNSSASSLRVPWSHPTPRSVAPWLVLLGSVDTHVDFMRQLSGKWAAEQSQPLIFLVGCSHQLRDERVPTLFHCPAVGAATRDIVESLMYWRATGQPAYLEPALPGYTSGHGVKSLLVAMRSHGHREQDRWALLFVVSRRAVHASVLAFLRTAAPVGGTCSNFSVPSLPSPLRVVRESGNVSEGAAVNRMRGLYRGGMYRVGRLCTDMHWAALRWLYYVELISSAHNTVGLCACTPPSASVRLGVY